MIKSHPALVATARSFHENMGGALTLPYFQKCLHDLYHAVADENSSDRIQQIAAGVRTKGVHEGYFMRHVEKSDEIR